LWTAVGVVGPHLVQHDVDAIDAACQAGLRSREAATDDVDHCAQ
jgi:hypothetical protein